MPLILVGGGLSRRYATFEAIAEISRADKVYVDSYTSIAPGIDEDFVKRVNPWAKVIRADRKLLEEQSHCIIEEARHYYIVILVPGDPMAATTHVSLVVEARRLGINVRIVPGVAGPYAAALLTGLQSYRFGKMVTLVYPEHGVKPYSVVETIWDNASRNLHTIVLLDLRLDEGKAMTIPEAVKILLELEKELARAEDREEVIAKLTLVGVARAGMDDYKCVAGGPNELISEKWPPPPHTLIVTAPRLHPIEAEALTLLCGCKTC